MRERKRDGRRRRRKTYLLFRSTEELTDATTPRRWPFAFEEVLGAAGHRSLLPLLLGGGGSDVDVDDDCAGAFGLSIVVVAGWCAEEKKIRRE